MALTDNDLHLIKSSVREVVAEVVTEVVTDIAVTKAEFQEFRTEIKSDLDRMESRLVTAIGLLERDSDTRLNDHEARIRRLEARMAP